MRNIKKMVIIFISTLCGTQVFGTIKYSTPIMLRSVFFKEANGKGRVFWTQAWSRDITNNPTDPTEKEGDWISGRWANRGTDIKAPHNHHEILIGTKEESDMRDENGNQFFIIQSADDPVKDGAVHYGDKIIILSPFSGPGLKEEAGLQAKPRVLWVNTPGALFYPDGGEIAVSDPAFDQTKTKKSHFAFVGLNKEDKGEVKDGAILYIESLSGDPKTGDALMFAYEFSRWGVGYQCPVFKKGDAREGENGKFEIHTIRPSELTASGKKAYDQMMAAPGYSFLKKVQEEPVKEEKAKENEKETKKVVQTKEVKKSWYKFWV